jgi:hypothetical protein
MVMAFSLSMEGLEGGLGNPSMKSTNEITAPQTALANRFNVPLIGCASHRLNLACLIISKEEALLVKVAAVMRLL